MQSIINKYSSRSGKHEQLDMSQILRNQKQRQRDSIVNGSNTSMLTAVKGSMQIDVESFHRDLMKTLDQSRVYIERQESRKSKKEEAEIKVFLPLIGTQYESMPQHSQIKKQNQKKFGIINLSSDLDPSLVG